MHDEMVPFEMGWKLYHVPVFTHESNPDTFFVQHPNLFARVASYASALLLVAGAVLKIMEKARKR